MKDAVRAFERMIRERERELYTKRMIALKKVKRAFEKHGPLTNRQIAEAVGLNLGSIRKWVQWFLPPDPVIGSHAGIPRKHSLEDTYRVVTGGMLSSWSGLSKGDAQKILAGKGERG